MTKSEVHLSADGEVYRFRRPDLTDLLLLDEELPLLPEDRKILEDISPDEKGDRETIEKLLSGDPKKQLRLIARCDGVLVRCSLDEKEIEHEGETIKTRKIVEGVESENGFVPVRSIGGMDRIVMGMILFGLSGYNRDSTVEILPFGETSDSCELSTGSLDDTVGDRAS